MTVKIKISFLKDAAPSTSSTHLQLKQVGQSSFEILGDITLWSQESMTYLMHWVIERAG